MKNVRNFIVFCSLFLFPISCCANIHESCSHINEEELLNQMKYHPEYYSGNNYDPSSKAYLKVADGYFLWCGTFYYEKTSENVDGVHCPDGSIMPGEDENWYMCNNKIWTRYRCDRCKIGVLALFCLKLHDQIYCFDHYKDRGYEGLCELDLQAYIQAHPECESSGGYWSTDDINSVIGGFIKCQCKGIGPTRETGFKNKTDFSCECLQDGTHYSVADGKCIENLKEIKNEPDVENINRQIDTTYERIISLIDGLKKNVWRDEDGNFNTSRLVSDSVAGVALGTVSGIVTLNLVKKAQVKKGFEDIGCYIGGQSVGDYGDEFIVGQ